VRPAVDDVHHWHRHPQRLRRRYIPSFHCENSRRDSVPASELERFINFQSLIDQHQKRPRRQLGRIDVAGGQPLCPFLQGSVAHELLSHPEN
jgi:hypothetical protein